MVWRPLPFWSDKAATLTSVAGASSSGGVSGAGGAGGAGVASGIGMGGAGGTGVASGVGMGSAGGTGAASSSSGLGGTPGTGENPTPAGEKRVTVAATLTVDTHNKDAVRVMLDALRNSVEDGTLSWMQLSLQATTTPEAADDINTKAQASGMHPTITDL